MRNKKNIQKRLPPKNTFMGKGSYAVQQNKNIPLPAKQPLPAQQRAVQYPTAATKYLQ